jgi:hypothetical protein
MGFSTRPQNEGEPTFMINYKYTISENRFGVDQHSIGVLPPPICALIEVRGISQPVLFSTSLAEFSRRSNHPGFAVMSGREQPAEGVFEYSDFASMVDLEAS